MAFRSLTRFSRRSFLAAGALAAQEVGEAPEKPIEFICPMDPEVRQKGPGRCPRCNMKLVAGLPDPLEYRVDLAVPKPIRAGKSVPLRFTVVYPQVHPKTGKPVRDFEIVHEKLFHLFLVSEDLEVFDHVHPEKDFGPEFSLDYAFPKPGMYRLMCDYYPLGATPQITVKTLYVAAGPGGAIPPLPSNTQVTLRTEPEKPLAGEKTRLYFTISPVEKLVPWLGAWGHVLIASADTVDLIHTHPFIADGGERMQFNAIFPRPGRHRVWVQFDRAGLVNTVRFDVPVTELTV